MRKKTRKKPKKKKTVRKQGRGRPNGGWKVRYTKKRTY
jgi:hypothetical protein